MPNNCKDITGVKFNRLTAISYAYSKNKKTYWNCVCDCGNEKVVSYSNLKFNGVKSCGCMKDPTIHNMSSTRVYRIYYATILMMCPIICMAVEA